MIPNNIKRLAESGVPFNVGITTHIDPAKFKDNVALNDALKQMCEKITDYTSLLNNMNGFDVTIDAIKSAPVVSPNKKSKKPLPKHPWRRKGLIYRTIEDILNMRYTTLEDILIVEYDGLHFKTTWEDVRKISRLSDRELKRNKINETISLKLSPKSMTGFILFVNAFKEGKVKLPENIHTTQEVKIVTTKPIECEQPKINLSELSFKHIPNDNFMTYATCNNMLVLRLGETIVTTSWKEVHELSKLDRMHLRAKMIAKYPTCVSSRSLLVMFTNKYREGILTDVNIEKDIFSEWADIKASSVKKESNFTYKTKRDDVLICRNNEYVLSNWNIIINLAQYHATRIFEEISKLKYTEKEAMLLYNFIVAYRENRAIDPDAGYRKMLELPTSTNYDGNKIEGTLEV